MRLHAFLLSACFFLSASFSAADEIARWDFDTANHGWAAVNDVEIRATDGKLHVVPAGSNPAFATRIQAAAGTYRLTIHVRSIGIQTGFRIFWTTEKDTHTAEERSAKAVLSRFDGVEPCRVWFQTDSPLTSIRIEPPNEPVMVESIELVESVPKEIAATAVADMSVADGFHVELLHSVDAETHGSWVSMTPDPVGRLIVSDQYGKLYRITPPPVGSDAEIGIEPINVNIGMAQGLLCAFDSLYVMVNGTSAARQGLYRVSDSNGDDQYDTAEFLRRLHGSSEHGPHGIVLAPDGKSLYVCAGNHTDLTEFSASRLPRNWQEDFLLPRLPDPGGHAAGRMAPGGWIARVSPDGTTWELVGAGFRNEYDLAFNPDGELFTYDADMERDIPTPWYRPTRVNHVTSGAEFGWRLGSGKWPDWYPDSLGSVADVGPGSPTGIVFGTGAAFPEKYQRALFICDWSYGMISAVHLEPKGSSYTGTVERFISAAPLPSTDIVVNPVDRAMYFTIGGRQTQSGLYRVTYTGTDDTAAVAQSPGSGAELRRLRRQLEALHHLAAEDAIARAWPYLGHEDRHIRYAARIAVEHQPVQSWARRAATENSSVDAMLTALLALARNGGPEWQPAVLQQLVRLADRCPSETQVLVALRVLGLAFIRMGPPDTETAAQVAGALQQYFPSDSRILNQELCALLVYLDDDSVAEKALQLLKNADTEEEQLYYAYCLRQLKQHWTHEQRAVYFRWFVKAAEQAGPNPFAGFLDMIRRDAISNLSDAEAEALRDVLALVPKPAGPIIESASRPFVQDWKVDDLIADAQSQLHGRSFENGRRMFRATGCYKCHRFAGRGGIAGPDLSAVGRRFNTRNMLESIIEPSKEVSDQYIATIFLMDTGKQVVGRVVNLVGEILMVCENLLAPGALQPGALTLVSRAEVVESFASQVSMMPKGLLNNLAKDEILDLLAYLKAGGNPDAPEFAIDSAGGLN